jgi:hypothetical protein
VLGVEIPDKISPTPLENTKELDIHRLFWNFADVTLLPKLTRLPVRPRDR